MNRRAFLASLAAALVLDPERALWVPGKKLISVPPTFLGPRYAPEYPAYRLRTWYRFDPDGKIFRSVDDCLSWETCSYQEVPKQFIADQAADFRFLRGEKWDFAP